jgi:hypothetical protein
MKEEAAATYVDVMRQLPDDLTGLAKGYFDYAGGKPGDDFLKLEEARWAMFLARYLVGLTRLADGDRAGARAALENALATKPGEFSKLDMVRTILQRMDQGPSWPPWIPAN